LKKYWNINIKFNENYEIFETEINFSKIILLHKLMNKSSKVLQPKNNSIQEGFYSNMKKVNDSFMFDNDTSENIHMQDVIKIITYNCIFKCVKNIMYSVIIGIIFGPIVNVSSNR